MTFDEKVRSLQIHLAAYRIKAGASAPLLWRLMWKLGLKVPPPHFLRFLPLALICGSFFALSWGLTMYLILWRAQQLPLHMVLGAPLLAGLMFGITMAFVFRRQARRLKLPAWDTYTGTPSPR